MLAKQLTKPSEKPNSETSLAALTSPEGYFSVIGKKGLTQFYRDCDKVLDGFKSKFPVGQPGNPISTHSPTPSGVSCL